MLSFVVRGLSLKRLDIFLTRASFRVVLRKAKAREKSARKGTEMLRFFSTLHASQKKRRFRMNAREEERRERIQKTRRKG